MNAFLSNSKQSFVCVELFHGGNVSFRLDAYRFDAWIHFVTVDTILQYWMWLQNENLNTNTHPSFRFDGYHIVLSPN